MFYVAATVLIGALLSLQLYGFMSQPALFSSSANSGSIPYLNLSLELADKLVHGTTQFNDFFSVLERKRA